MTEDLILLLDQDGPLASFDEAAFAACEREGWGVDCTLITQQHRFMTDHMPDDDHRTLLRKIIDEPGWFRNLPVVEGAREGLKELAEHFEVWICTKPLESSAVCRDDKAAWLVEHFGREWERRMIPAPDKSMVRGHILLDDAPNLEEIQRALWLPIVFPMSWNQQGSDWEGLPCWTWGDDPERLVQWARANQTMSPYERLFA